jgi:uncharacterized protein YndB with AHSA1/START domain
MAFQEDPQVIRWRLQLKSPMTKVYEALSTNAGRASFWAESAIEWDGMIHFVFPNKVTWNAPVLHAIPPRYFAVQYIGDSEVVFTLKEDGRGGTDLLLTDRGVPAENRTEVIAGWVSVLMTLKAYLDFDVDLRAHDETRHWDMGYVEN